MKNVKLRAFITIIVCALIGGIVYAVVNRPAMPFNLPDATTVNAYKIKTQIEESREWLKAGAKPPLYEGVAVDSFRFKGGPTTYSVDVARRLNRLLTIGNNYRLCDDPNNPLNGVGVVFTPEYDLRLIAKEGYVDVLLCVTYGMFLTKKYDRSGKLIGSSECFSYDLGGKARSDSWNKLLRDIFPNDKARFRD